MINQTQANSQTALRLFRPGDQGSHGWDLSIKNIPLLISLFPTLSQTITDQETIDPIGIYPK